MYTQHHFRCLEGAGPVRLAPLPGLLSWGRREGPRHQGWSTSILPGTPETLWVLCAFAFYSAGDWRMSCRPGREESPVQDVTLGRSSSTRAGPLPWPVRWLRPESKGRKGIECPKSPEEGFVFDWGISPRIHERTGHGHCEQRMAT